MRENRLSFSVEMPDHMQPALPALHPGQAEQGGQAHRPVGGEWGGQRKALPLLPAQHGPGHLGFQLRVGYQALRAPLAVPLPSRRFPEGEGQWRLRAESGPAARALQCPHRQSPAKPQSPFLRDQRAQQQLASLVAVEPHLIKAPPVGGPLRLHVDMDPVLTQGQCPASLHGKPFLHPVRPLSHHCMQREGIFFPKSGKNYCVRGKAVVYYQGIMRGSADHPPGARSNPGWRRT